MAKNKEAKKVEAKKAKKEAFTDEIKRLNRISGQVEGIKKMVAENRKLGDVLIQCRAVHSALKSIETRLIEQHAEYCIEDILKTDKKKNRQEKADALLDLFRRVE